MYVESKQARRHQAIEVCKRSHVDPHDIYLACTIYSNRLCWHEQVAVVRTSKVKYASGSLTPQTTAPRAKPKFVEPLKPARILAKPQGFVPLRTFSCGNRGSQSEKLVNNWALGVFKGKRREADTSVLVLEDAHSRLVGISSFRPKPLNDPEEWSAAERGEGPAYYIHFIAIDRSYRGQRMADGSRLGDALMSATLEHIGGMCDGRIPRVWAIIRPENAPAKTLFERHGFRRSRLLEEDEIIYSRPWESARLGPGGLARRIARVLGGRGS
jgi:ribosomal protein S18 acetylase RimI-like enzyme